MERLNRFAHFYFGTRPKAHKQQIIECTKTSKFFNRSGNETTMGATAILLIASRGYRAWLVKTNKRLYKIHDYDGRGCPIVSWTQSANLPGEVKVTIDRKARKDIGKIKFVFTNNKTKECKYSKNLFVNCNKSVYEIIMNLIA